MLLTAVTLEKVRSAATVGVAVMTTSLPDKSAYRENGTIARALCSA
jgi:hypothetical protein